MVSLISRQKCHSLLMKWKAMMNRMDVENTRVEIIRTNSGFVPERAAAAAASSWERNRMAN